MRPSRRQSSRWQKRCLFAVLVASVPALATLAFAEPRTKPAPRPRPAPVAKVDAQAPSDESSGGEAKPAAAQAESVPAPPSELYDGGPSSPLNPQPEELPSSAVSAAAPVDYERLLADVAALRARVAAIADNVYQSRVSVALQTDGDRVKMTKLTVSLDDGIVFTAPAAFSASDMTAVYERAVAPGRHAVTVDVERKDAQNETFRTSQRSRFTIDVPRDHRVAVEVKILDDSTMGADFPSDQKGTYDLRFRVKAVGKRVGK